MNYYEEIKNKIIDNETLNDPADEITGVEIKKVNGIEVTEGITTDIPYKTETTVEVLVKHSVEADETKTYTVGTNNEVAWDVTPTNGLGNGQLSVTVEGGETATVAVNVKDYVESITLNKENAEAEKGTELKDLGVTYTVNYAKAGASEAKSINDGVTLNPAYDANKSQSYTVTYTDNDTNSYTKTHTFDKTLNVKLNEKEPPVEKDKVTGFTLNKTEVTAEKGTELKDLGVAYTVTYEKAGEQEAKSITDGVVKISPAYDSNKENQTITITYTDDKENSETKAQNIQSSIHMVIPKHY